MKLLINAPRCDHPERILEAAQNPYAPMYGRVLEPGDMTRYEFDIHTRSDFLAKEFKLVQFALQLNNCGGGFIQFSNSNPLCSVEYHPTYPTEQVKICHRWDLVDSTTLEQWGYVHNGNAHTASILGTFITAYLAFHHTYELAGIEFKFDDVEFY